MADVKKAIRDHLVADPAVSALVGTAIYSGRAPAKAPLPRIIFNQVSGTHLHHLNGASGLANARLAIDCFAEGSSASYALGEAVRLALQGFIGQMGDLQVEFIFLEDRDSLFYKEDPTSPDGRDRDRLDFLVWFHEEIPTFS